MKVLEEWDEWLDSGHDVDLENFRRIFKGIFTTEG